MKEQIIIINASPRKNGYSSQIINYITKRLHECNLSVKVYNIYDMNIGYCNNCGYCSKKVGCRLKDDMTDLYKHFDESISTIVVSPVAFDGPMAKFKTLVDRTNMLFHSKYTLKTPAIDRNKKRVGYFIQVAGSEHYPTQFLGGDVIGGFFFKAINTKLEHELHIGNTDEVNPIEDTNTMLRIKSSLEAYIWDVLLLTKSKEV
jgi:multimeric flavodoxin WrbA